MSKSKMTPIKNSTYLFGYNNKENDRENHSYWLDSQLVRNVGIQPGTNINQLEFTSLCHGKNPSQITGDGFFKNAIQDFQEWYKQDMRKDELLKQKNSPNGLNKEEQSELNSLKPLRQMGWQCSFHATKSLAIAYELGDDAFKDKIDDCMQRAFQRVGDSMTQDIKGHKLKGSSKGNDIAGLAIGVHIHRSNRAQDPSLHGHMSIPNIALGADGKMKTISNFVLCKNYHKYSALFREELAKGLQKEGISIEPDKDYSFRVKAIPKELEEHFNKRTKAIDSALEQYCKKSGINQDSLSDRERSSLRDKFALELRKNKADTLMHHKVEKWKEEVKNLGYSIEGINQEVNKKDFSQLQNRLDNNKAIEEIFKEIGKLKKSNFTEKTLDKIINDKKQFFDYDHKAIKEKILEHCKTEKITALNKRTGKEYSFSRIVLAQKEQKQEKSKSPIEQIKLKEPVKQPSKINQSFCNSMSQIPKRTNIHNAFNHIAKDQEASKQIGGGASQGGNANALSGKEKFIAIAEACKAQAFELTWKSRFTNDSRERNNLLSQAGALLQQAELSFFQGIEIDKSKGIER